MAKKTKAQKRAIRKQGWQDVKSGAKTLLVDMTKQPFQAAGKAMKSNIQNALSGLSGRSNKTKQKGNETTAFIDQAVKQIPQGLKAVGQVVKGTFKGIFNHPDWYTYKGNLSKPSNNILRPFNAKALKPILAEEWNGGVPNKYSGSGAGVTHVVDVNVEFNDMRNEEGFKLAMIEAFRAIRLDLKSNLPYKQAEYDAYVMMACSVYVKAKMVEKVLGMYNYTRGDIPELSRALKTVPYNYYEKGILTPTQIDMISDPNYADTLTKFGILKATCSNIAIPRKLAEYLSWWVGSTFVDQAAPNPQLYTTMLRRCPVYTIDSDGNLQINGLWDVASGDIQTIIDEATELLTEFGIMNADIVKTGRYGFCDLVLPEQYSTVLLNDPEFFSILINAYPSLHTADPLDRVFNDEYIRVDALEEVNEANLVGMTNALADWAGFTTLVGIISMACYVDVDNTFSLPSFISVYSDGNAVDASVYEEDGAWVQILGIDSGSDIIRTATTTTQETINVTYDKRPDPTITPDSMVVNLAAGRMSTIGRILRVLEGNTQGYHYSLRVSAVDGNLQLWNDSTATKVRDYTYSGTITVTGNIVSLTSGSITINASDYAIMLGLLAAGAWNYAGLTATVVFTTSASSNSLITYNSSALTSWFCEMVDYHLPVIVYSNIEAFLDGNRTVAVLRPPVLLKECYKPMVFSYADIKAVLYWMYLGLFSME